MTTLEDITAYLHAHIPLTRALGVVAQRWDGASLVLGAPLAPNLNHRRTAFGGSLSATAILAGWGAVHLGLRERGVVARVVIQRSGIEYLAPATGDFAATATLPAGRSWERFLAALTRHGRGRLEVPSSVACGAVAVAAHDGTYAAFAGPEP